MTRELWKGNEAIAEAAVRAGLQAYFGYPITPQTEALEYLSWRMPELGRAFLQAESELGAINMVYGAACAGARTMTSTSSPGTSLMMEGLSYIAGTEIPMVLVDVVRGGPGLGNIAPAQGDYNQIVHGGGHGDYHPIVFAPSGIQETVDTVYEMFDIADKYRTIGIVMVDGSIGQMMEPAEMPPMKEVRKEWPAWSTSGMEGKRDRNVLTSIYLDPKAQEITNLRMMKNWQVIEKNEIRYKEYFMEDAKFAVVGFGSAGRVALSAVRAARAEGIPVGLFRPISLSPFPKKQIFELSQKLQGLFVVEMNSGMMLDDVLLASQGRVPVEFYGRMGGIMPFPDEILREIKRLHAEGWQTEGHPRDRWLAKLDRIIAEE
ncbi:MAG: 3-methyl-2-oxobutanoate dehydrogenase subunit VorB [Chloroflexi bacterium]|jgi:2-oxoglutarate ferredoxin oxidoreductase subunit alpha|nr:3-methyl-2-oxobutanoate dehydrogenase subunit VorB [Chloroflexota bacterium]